ncbi:MAG: T9SS C-terminal target domain-containing protein, partial [Bacteroidota bacterium]
MRKIYLAVTMCLVTILSFAQPAETPTKVITDNGGQGTGTATWSSDTVYVLEGRVFVNAGDVLTIEAGTVIKGRASEDPQNAAVLVVARGAQLIADGTAQAPIIFTAERDDVTVAGDVEEFERGLWGGLVVLGNATTNRGGNEGQIEGIVDAEDPRVLYGGDNDEDNSGILRYISIRHGGTAIAPDNEINGLTLGAVGSGTTIEYIEVYANFDDGVEWFGGTVNTKYLSVAFCGDDSYDYDEGFRGKGQFWFTIQDEDGDRGGEHDGGTDPETGEPFAIPIVYNATYLGSGNPNDESPSRALTLRDNAGGQYWNSIFADFSRGIDVELLASGTHSFDRLEAGEAAFAGDIFFNIDAGATAEDLFTITAGEFGDTPDSAATVDAA